MFVAQTLRFGLKCFESDVAEPQGLFKDVCFFKLRVCGVEYFEELTVSKHFYNVVLSPCVQTFI